MIGPDGSLSGPIFRSPPTPRLRNFDPFGLIDGAVRYGRLPGHDFTSAPGPRRSPALSSIAIGRMQLPIVNDTNSPPMDNRAESRVETDGEASIGRGNYAVISLGCPKNLVDTEQMLGRLDEDGYRMVDSVDTADFVVVNTCGFIDSAREESLGAIDEMLALKRQGKIRNVVVTGCLAERQQGKLLEARPEIDALVGVFGRNEIVSVVDRLQSGVEEQQKIFRPAAIRPLSDAVRRPVTPRHFAYLKISEGCDRLCTFLRHPQDARQTLQQADRASG